MAAVGYERGFGGDVQVAPGGGEGVAEFFQADAFAGRDDQQLPAWLGKERGEGAADGSGGFDGDGVGFVEQEDGLLVGVCAGRDGFGAGQKGGGLVGQIEHCEDQLGVGEFCVGAFDADAFDGVVAVAEAGRIDEAEEDAVEVAGLFDRVSGCAGDV